MNKERLLYTRSCTVLLLPFQSDCLNFFFLPNCFGRIPNIMLNRNCENCHSFLFPDLRRKELSLSPLRMMLAVRFFADVFYQSEEVLFLLFVFLVCWAFFFLIMKGYWILANAFSVFIEHDIFLSEFLTSKKKKKC